MISDKIVLFDGICNFCSSSVQFLIKHDKKSLLRFASLQSPVGRELLEKYKVPPATDSIVFIENDKAFVKSDAALRIAANLGDAWKLFTVFSILPSSFRNIFYDIIARNRYRWFGKKESCMLPSPEIRSRFMDV